MAGLTLGNNEINKRMKNKTILVFRGNNLGTFKFKKNFFLNYGKNFALLYLIFIQ